MRKPHVAMIVLGLLVGFGLWFGYDSLRIVLREGYVQARVTQVPTTVAGRVKSVRVQVGDVVAAGTVLVHLDGSRQEKLLADARAALKATVQRGGDAAAEGEGAGASVAGLEAAVADATREVAEGGRGEEAARRELEYSSLLHSRALLAARTREMQGGGQAAMARAEERDAKARLDAARERFEKVSQHRAAREAEYHRLRDMALMVGPAIEEVKRVAQQRAVLEERVRHAEHMLAATQVVAREPGRVMRVDVLPGREVVAGQPVVTLVPEGTDGWSAVFAVRGAEAERVVQGMKCDVSIVGSTSLRFMGQVQSDALAAQAAGESAQTHVVVRMVAAEPEVLAMLAPGMAAHGVVWVKGVSFASQDALGREERGAGAGKGPKGAVPGTEGASGAGAAQGGTPGAEHQ